MIAAPAAVVIPRPPGSGGATVRLLGEPSDWVNGVPVGEEGLRLELPPGVWAYKLRVDGEWVLDPSNPRTRGAIDGSRNNVLSVGGAPEPVLFAPAAPFLRLEDRGGLTVSAALRRDAGDRLTLRWCEDRLGAPGARLPVERSTAMTLALEEPEHRVFRVRLPVVPALLRFALADGRTIGPEAGGEHFEVAPPWLGDPLPRWWREAVLYTIFVDRFRPQHDRPGWVRPLGSERAGGHLEGVRRSLGELRDLGVTALYLTPVHVAASAHRYDVVDPLAIDPALGGRAAFERLVEDVHGHGMRLLLDFSFSHAGRGFPAYEEVLAQGRAAPRAGWFQWREGALVHYGKRTDAPLFDLQNAQVQELVLRTAEHVAGLGVDGVRLDSVAEVPLPLAREVRSVLRRRNPEAVLLGELIPTHAHRWLAAGALDAATDFGAHTDWTWWLAVGSTDAADLARSLAATALTRGAAGARNVRFVSTHDHPRFATLASLGGAPQRADLGMLLLLSDPAVPMLLYGEEHGLHASEARVMEDVWPDRMPMPFPPGAHGSDPVRRERLRELLALRAAHVALREGDSETVLAEGALLAMRRSAGGETFDVVINRGDEPRTVALPCASHPTMQIALSIGDVQIGGSALRLGRRSGAIVRRHAPSVSTGSRAANQRRRDDELRRGAEQVVSRPSRIDFGVTERCNLRCRHCLAFAPQRTAAGTARTMSPWLLDRLRGDLPFVDYSCIGDLGEALTSPMLFELLAALRGTPVVHLLTNGMLLDAEAAVRLAEAGVRSIMVSLDGATAHTSDTIRTGASFERVISNLRDVVDVRRARSLDLRLGISCVVTRSSLGELEDLATLCAQFGLDWVKFEELVSVGGLAPDLAPAVAPDASAAAVRLGVVRAQQLGLRAVDHTRTRTLWRCRLEASPEHAEFLAADEFANRTEIHPCRVAWEHVCVAANGDVRLGDAFGPLLGNLAEQDLTAMWNGLAARAERRRAIRGRACGSGPVTCLT